MNLDINQIRAINTEVESMGPFNSQSIDNLVETGVKLAAFLPWTGEQMALAKKIMNEKRSQMYERFILNQTARGLPIFPSVVKDYVNSKCSEEQFNYDMCERCNRSLVHVLDMLRSVFSTLKEELKLTQQSNSFQ